MFNLRNVYLGGIFQEHNTGVKRDLPVLHKISSFSQASIPSATIERKINNVVAVLLNLSKKMSKHSCLKCIRMELKMKCKWLLKSATMKGIGRYSVTLNSTA